MTQSELNSAVARRTGEDLDTIRNHGFSMIDPFDPDFDPEPDDLLPQMVDWDQLEQDRQFQSVAAPAITRDRRSMTEEVFLATPY